MAAIESRIHVDTRYFPSAELAVPALAVQTTRLVDTYMLWVGTTDVEPDQAETAPLQGCLAKDWACAMPVRQTVRPSTPAAATPLYRSSSSEAALSMAQRLARRFKKQIFLSIDVPPSLGSMGQEGKLLLAIERALVDNLKSHEAAGDA
ncbi:uncharacterized protein TRAVEDRAFT_113826 [Trametes versicolor FP-101664 SS1]|uniref:uncharacterized protein n=1 Tax=Trametes versicolor (strain FP-101664) TaxID=717944 RepID=UPI00046236CF|nr:uncharacterized protein TRAVEDRAFT_113826 [Trametes versicolor FP-101664 SS1]EIW63366.1 hypothetical protein TRAVEDRAFT_113826 [Trametes versicolor FP-101664 SS1]